MMLLFFITLCKDIVYIYSVRSCTVSIRLHTHVYIILQLDMFTVFRVSLVFEYEPLDVQIFEGDDERVSFKCNASSNGKQCSNNTCTHAYHVEIKMCIQIE